MTIMVQTLLISCPSLDKFSITLSITSHSALDFSNKAGKTCSYESLDYISDSLGHIVSWSRHKKLKIEKYQIENAILHLEDCTLKMDRDGDIPDTGTQED